MSSSIEEIRDYALRRGWKAAQKNSMLTLEKENRRIIVSFSSAGSVSAAQADGRDITGSGKMAKIRREIDG